VYVAKQLSAIAVDAMIFVFVSMFLTSLVKRKL